MTALLRAPLALLTLTLSLPAQDQSRELTIERLFAEARPEMPRIGWIPGTRALFEVTPHLRGGEVLHRVEAADMARRELTDTHALRAAFAAAGVTLPEDSDRFPDFTFVSEETLRFAFDDAVWHWNLRKSAPDRRLAIPDGATASAFAPDDGCGVFVVDENLVAVYADGRVRQLTWDGAAGDIAYGGAAHRAEFGIEDGLWWDPTGRFLAFSREDLRPNAPYPYVDLTCVPPRARHGRYPMAGDPHSRVTIGVYDRETTALRYLESDPAADLYWTNVTFAPDGSRVYVALVGRGQDHVALVEFDARTGERLRTLLEESDPEWVEPEAGPIFLPDGSGFLWFSTRSGYRHLWRHALDGTRLWQESAGDFDVREFVGFSADGEHAYVRTSGPSPLQDHLYQLRLGRPQPAMTVLAMRPKMAPITREPGTHRCSLSVAGDVLDRWSNLYNPGVIQVILTDGRRRQLHSATDPLAHYARGTQQFFEVEADDGTPLYGHVILPPGIDELKRYPLLLYVYGGPKSQLVRDVWGGGASPWLHWMAMRGYVVARLDNRGTDNRGIEFAQIVHRHLGEVEVIDQLAAVHAVLDTWKFVDEERVGVHGWSFGGYMTLRLMLLAPGIFRAGVSGAPVTDWRFYETGYTERYMDTPQENPEGYADSSVLPLAGNLAGRLLLVHGTDDRTVMWSNATAFLDACIAAGELVDFMAYPMQQHGLRGTARLHFHHLMTRFFDEHLMGSVPGPVLPASLVHAGDGQ